MRNAFVAIICLSIAGIAIMTFQHPHDWIAPGDMMTGHREIEHDCFVCHAPLIGVPPRKCIACHRVEDIGKTTTKGVTLPSSEKPPFHQYLVDHTCTDCHGDHKIPIGVRLRQKPFSHELVAISMRMTCEGCHARPSDPFHRNFTRECSRCHATDRWKPTTFDHAKHFELDRDHNVACETCHIQDDFNKYTCYGCHEHDPREVRREHDEEKIENIENCASCHRNAHDEPQRRSKNRDRRDND